MQSLGHIASDQDFRIADFVTAKNLWRSNRTHLMPVARVVIEQNFHVYRLTSRLFYFCTGPTNFK